MNRKGIFGFPILAVLAAAFLLVSLLVYLSRGRPGLIRAKLKLGALLLGLTGTLGSGCNTGQVTCYLPAPQEMMDIEIEVMDDWGVVLDLDQGHQLHASLSFRKHDAFSFRILNEEGIELQRGEILPADGAYDSSSEDCVMEIDENLSLGQHWLDLHTGPPGEIEDNPQLGHIALSAIRSEV